MKENIKYLVFSLALLSNIVFFSISSLVGFNFEGSEYNSIYSYFCAFLFVAVLLFVFLDFKKIAKKHLLFLPCVFLFLYFVESSFFEYNRNQQELMQQSIRCFIAFSVPCIFVAIDLASTKRVEKIFPWIDAIAFIISIGCLLTLPKLLISGTIEYGGSNYQQLSYNAAFGYSVLLYNALTGNEYRLDFLKNKIVSVISLLLIFSCIVCVLSSGGRGGFALMMLNTLYLLYCKRKSFISIKSAISIISIIILIIYFVDFSVFKELIDFGFERIKDTFFSNGGSAISKSGRDEVYDLALKYISENPLGYGFFRSYAVMGNYPHNFFLEILMDGGYLLLVLCFFFMIFLYKKSRKIIKNGFDITFLIIMSSYPIVMLQFTSTFMWVGLFWFIVIYILCYDIRSMNIHR